MAWVSLNNLTRFYTKLKEKFYLKTEIDTKVNTLNTAINNISTVYYGDGVDSTIAPLNADQLQGHPANYFATSGDMTAKANKSDILTLEEIQASTDLSGKIASASSLKGIMTNSLPCYTYENLSSENINNPFQALVDLRNVTTECFNKGSIIHIKNAYDGYHTYLIGSTNANFFTALSLSYYNEYRLVEIYNFSSGTWRKHKINVTEY